MVLLVLTGSTQGETYFTHCHFFPLPIGSSLPGMMEANEVSQSCATADAAKKLWELWGERKKKTGRKEVVGGRQFDREALLWPIAAHEPPNLK